MPETDLPLLLAAAARAGEIATSYFGTAPATWDKPGDAGPVTEADIAVNAMLAEMLRGARPDYGWLSEETEDDPARRLSTRRQFVVDPIDGTRAFIAGEKDWAHAFAVIEDGRVISAVVASPLHGLTYAASLGGGATCNGAPLRASPQTDITQAHVLASKPNLATSHWVSPPVFRRSFRSSLAYRLALVAEGRFDAMITLRPTWEWDIAAGSLLVTESGGHATDRRGSDLRFNNPVPQVDGTVAAGALHPALIAALA